MMELTIPDFGELRLNHLVMDYNGTLACDGIPMPGIKDRFEALSKELCLQVITADTFGRVRADLEGWPCSVQILSPGNQAEQKLAFVRELGTQSCACLGNGRNDRLMLEAAALGVAVLLDEGAAREALLAADVVTPGILPALDLLLHPLRLTASLRS